MSGQVMKDNIADFMASWNTYDTLDLPRNWNRRFQEAGYISVMICAPFHDMSEIILWCDQHIGKDHYAWVGVGLQYVNYWFETEQNAMMFSLCWLNCS